MSSGLSCSFVMIASPPGWYRFFKLITTGSTGSSRLYFRPSRSQNREKPMNRSALLFPLLLPLLTMASVFDAPELRVAPSPAQAAQIHLAPGTRVVDSDVSPAGPRVALLVADAAGARQVVFWEIGQPQADRKSTRLNSSHLGISY